MTLREYILEDALDGAAYGMTLLGCAPLVNLLHFAALVAADYLLIPTGLNKLAANDVRDNLQSLVALKRISHCQVADILPTFYERVTLESHAQLILLAQTLGRPLLPSIPPRMPSARWPFVTEKRFGIMHPMQKLCRVMSKTTGTWEAIN